ncbi:single-stranded-DNA-specific exonuclease RecJ [Paenibacillus sp. JMULE4]|uniref:single-stranded-DNA-specific exonuclease RecJ n=1 Tax=Paenibacillus sp. JMULE4 TaxID=2518342 RepID=UPI001575C585|nr:single-stranded-DNA-specific exonuclease RecJ [Paenibacillus sp. JMULE4]NTZ17214.1 single-stranded-DNA-specific exonuclease RecJ [Paenibacillus sp. JMULE4]
MLPTKARWSIGSVDPKAADALSQALNVSPLIARLLAVRGLTDIGHAARFLHGGTDQTHDPFLLDGMADAVKRIRRAMEAGEKIRVYGDYDADGVSSTTLMVHLLRQMNCRFDYYIPHRIHEGYGLNIAALDAAKEQGVKLIVTVDTGISAVEQIAYANSIGLDVVVTDHHEPPDVLPPAYAIINPKKPGCPYPFKQLAGVGVALKLAQAILGRWPEELLEFAAIGTVADLMPLTEENRIIVKQGLERMRQTANFGIRALFRVAGIPLKDVNSTHIGFALAPRINASGRLLSADTSVRLLTATSEQEAEELAVELDQLNKERQRIVDEMAKQAVAMVEEQRSVDGELPKAIVLAQEDWNVGVIGIVASKIVDKYYLPTIILGIDKETGMAKGSARSIAGFDMYRALTHCQDLMEHYGGHQMAAGMTLAREHLPELARRMSALAMEWLAPEDFIPVMHADMLCEFSEVDLESIRQLELLGPFGMGNPSPRFVFKELALKDMRTIGKEQQHLKLSLQCARNETAAAVDAVGFGKGRLAEWISPTASIDVLGELSVNEWNGVQRPQIMIQDLGVHRVQLFDWRGTPRPDRKLSELCGRLKRHPQGPGRPPAVVVFGPEPPPNLKLSGAGFALWCASLHGRFRPCNEAAKDNALSEAHDVMLYSLPDRMEQLDALAAEAASVQRYYAAFGGTEEDKQSGILPGRDMFKSVYGAVMALKPKPASAEWTARRSGVPLPLTRFILDVFTELDLMESLGDGYRIIESTEKKDLTASLLYQSRMKRQDVEQELMYSSAKELLSRLFARHKQTQTMLEGII